MSNPQAWFHLGDQKTTENVNAIQNILDSAAQVLVEKIQNEPEENSEFVIKTTENVQLQVKHVKEFVTNDIFPNLSLPKIRAKPQ